MLYRVAEIEVTCAPPAGHSRANKTLQTAAHRIYGGVCRVIMAATLQRNCNTFVTV